ncbi:hypothetical protein [Marinifilum fragile]|uniref:hypothetical protein n=1 Tax=Marinifilum fragile TaxID=570161 RepID=UPI0006D24E4F|nr:hypothetical protein [Marinifilum fragile]
MRLFENIQSVVEAGRLIKVSVSASKALIITNKTKSTAILHPNASSKIGYPLETKESLEIEDIKEEADFWVFLEDSEIAEKEGLFLISQTETRDFTSQNTNNTVVIQKG